MLALVMGTTTRRGEWLAVVGAVVEDRADPKTDYEGETREEDMIDRGDKRWRWPRW